MSSCARLRNLPPLPGVAQLAGRAVEQNVFYDPGFALAAAPLLGADVRVGLVWSRAPRQLAGFFPVRIDRRRYGVPFAVTVGWTHPFAPLGTPLVDRDMAEPVIAAWLDHVAGDAALPDLMLLPLVAEADRSPRRWPTCSRAAIVGRRPSTGTSGPCCFPARAAPITSSAA